MLSTDDHEIKTGKVQHANRVNKNPLRRLWLNYQWPVILTLLLLSLLLGYLGFSKYSMAIGESRSPLDVLYLTLQLATIESGDVSAPVGWELEVARWLVPLLTAYTAALTAATLFRRQLQMVKLSLTRRHVIICGLGEKGMLLAQSFLRQGEAVVAIEKNLANPQVSLCRDQGIIVLIGDATEEASLRKAGAQRARYLIAVCGDDAANAEVAVKARSLNTNRRRGTLTCSIHLVNQQLYTLLREQEFGTHIFPSFRLEIFNIFERGAQVLLHKYPPFNVDHRNTGLSPHLLVVGLGNLGTSLVVLAARTWYEQQSGSGNKMRVSIIDREADASVQSLLRQYPKMAITCELIPMQDEIGVPAILDTMNLSNTNGECELDMIYVCLDEHSLGFQTALALRRRLGQETPPIIVRMPEKAGLATLLESDSGLSAATRNIHPFGLIQRTCTPDLVLRGTHELLAQAVHENYLRNRIEEGMRMGQKRAMVPWDALPEDLRESNRRQVDLIRLKLEKAGYGIMPLMDWESASYKFKEGEIELMARLEHEYWMEERQRDRWTYAPGPEDPKQKTHPDLLPWEKLPEAVKDKDRQAVADLPSLLARAGFQVIRIEK